MANKFVWSGAGGTNDGSSWDNAYTSLMRDWGAEAGFTPATDFVYVRSVHSESSGAALTVVGSTARGTTAPVRVLCVVGDTTGTAPGVLATGAAVTTTSGAAINIRKSLHIYGTSFYSNASIFVAGSSTDHNVVLESCRLELTSNSALDSIIFGVNGTGYGAKVTMLGTQLDFGAASQGVRLYFCDLSVRGGGIDFGLSILITYPSGGYSGLISFADFDASAITSGNLTQGAIQVDDDRRITFTRCLLGSGTTIVNGTIALPGFRVESYHCQIGTDADPSYQMEIQDSRGKISADTSHYRTGGASDGVRATPISWNCDTTVGSVRGYPGHPLESPPISIWTSGDGATAHTYRIAFASDASIKDDEIWMELEGPNDAATNSLAALKTTRVAPLTTSAAYTTDSGSTWNGSGVTTKQYMQITYTPKKPGPVTVRIMMAKASDNIYIDPKIQIDPA